MTAAIFIGVLLVLALLGVPLFVIIGAATALSFYMFLPPPGPNEQHAVYSLIQSMEGLLKRQEFLAIPLFMASGAVMTAGGMARRLIDVAKAAFGWMPGGLAIAAIVACGFFAMITGSSPVTLIAVGSIMFPALVESKYPENFSLGLVTTAGSLGCLLPPALAMLIYAISVTGSSASVTPEDMFLAGSVPALLIIFLLALYSMWVGARQVEGARAKFSWAALRKTTFDGLWALFLPVMVLGGIYGGFFTPSEAGAAATVYALVVTTVIYKELDLRRLFETMYEASALIGSLILIIVLAFGLNHFLALIEIQKKLMDLIQSMNLGPVGFMLLVNVILIVLGALMDSISATLIFAPLLAPVAHDLYGIDPLHFGVVFVVNMEIGYLMPPVATNLFVSAAVFKKPFGQVCRAVVPTLLITIVALGVVMYVPTISKAAVNWKYDRPIAEAFPWDGKPVAEVPGDGTDSAGGGPGDGAPDLQGLTGSAMEVFDEDYEDEEEEELAPDAGPEAEPVPGAPAPSE